MPDDQESTDQNDQNKDDQDDQNNDDDAQGDGNDDDKKTFDAPYVKKLRDEAAKHRREAREAKALAKKYEDENKTEAQKLEERATTAEQKATGSERELVRMRVALRKGLSETQAKRLLGDTEEELEKDADELLDSFKSTDSDRQDQSRRPRERLRPGAAPSAEEEETDPIKLAAQVPRMYG